MSEETIAYSLIALLVLAGVITVVVLARRARAKRVAEKGLGRIGRNYIDLRTPESPGES